MGHQAYQALQPQALRHFTRQFQSKGVAVEAPGATAAAETGAAKRVATYGDVECYVKRLQAQGNLPEGGGRGKPVGDMGRRGFLLPPPLFGSWKMLEGCPSWQLRGVLGAQGDA